MKKELVFIIFGVLILVGLIGFVSAQEPIGNDFGQIIKEFTSILSVFFEAVLGQSSGTGMFFERVLILLIIYAVVYSVLSKMDLFSSSGFVLFFISSAIAILSVKFINEGFIQAILLPYGALGGSIAIFLPFLIYFVFVHTSVKGTFGRRAAWILFGLVFVAIWISNFASGEFREITFNGMYLFGFIILIFLLAFDEPVHRYFEFGKISKAISNFHKQEIRQALADLRALEKHYRQGLTTAADYRAERKRLEAVIKSGAGGI